MPRKKNTALKIYKDGLLGKLKMSKRVEEVLGSISAEELVDQEQQRQLVQASYVAIMVDPKALAKDVIAAGKALTDLNGLDARSALEEKVGQVRALREALQLKTEHAETPEIVDAEVVESPSSPTTQLGVGSSETH
jgi:hypothetical protein